MKNSNALIVGLSSSKNLAKEISKNSNIELDNTKVNEYKDGEIIVEINSSVRNKIVFVVQSTSSPTSKNIIELLLTIDALKRSSASEIVLVIPYFGYSRQDKRGSGRQPISAKLFADLYEKAGISSVVTFDLHSDQIEGFFNVPVDNLKASGILFRRFKKEYKDKSFKNLVVIAPDHGGVARARMFAKLSKSNIAIIDKRRVGPNKAESYNIIGEVKDIDCVIIDDLIDTGGTITNAINLLKEQGARNIYVVATHAIFSKLNNNEDSLEKLLNTDIEYLILSNSIQKTTSKNHPKLLIADLTEPIIESFKTHLEGKSITKVFLKKYGTDL